MPEFLVECFFFLRDRKDLIVFTSIMDINIIFQISILYRVIFIFEG